jgi:protein involved in polysaccharide export with SLBB domain
MGLTACNSTYNRYPRPTAAMAAKEPTPPYRIRIGDQLAIRFYKTPELDVEAVPVRNDGMISIAPLGDVEAAGKRPDELGKYLSEQYSGELSNPRVTVIIKNFGGQVFVEGMVASPSAHYYVSGLTALQAIALAGGFRDEAMLDNAILIRKEDDQYKGYRMHLDEVLRGHNPESDVELLPGDIVYVPRSKIADVNLFMKQYITNNIPTIPISIPVF